MTRACELDDFWMYERALGIAVALIAVAVSPLLVEGGQTSRCEMVHRRDYVEHHCPVNLTSEQCLDSWGSYSECVTVHVWIKADDFHKSPRVEILSPVKEIIKPILVKRTNVTQRNIKRKQHEIQLRCRKGVPQVLLHSNATSALLVHGGIEAEAGSVVSVLYSTTSTSCIVNYTVQDPMPQFNLSVSQSSKSVTVMVEPGDKVRARLCYENNPVCLSRELPPPITVRKIDPSQSPSALLNMTYPLPCVCMEVFYTYRDALRNRKCPFKNQSLADVGDVWLHATDTLYPASLTWQFKCPARDFNISAALCWRQHQHLCTSAPNSTLEDEGGGQLLEYNTSAVDKHPQMCVQLSLQGSRHISCPFQAGMSSWEVYIGPGRQSVYLYLTTRVPATFSAQLCILNASSCTPQGEIHYATMDATTTNTKINVPICSVAEKPCVQVWQSDPPLRGRRILCPDYTHNRYALYAVAASIFVVIAALVGTFIHRLTKSEAAGWLCVCKQVLLVGSSEQSPHITAVCTLASILQVELNATVHMSLWAQSSQTQAGARTGVADLGPLPWLYGQWEAVSKAQGRVLIVWSPEAKEVYKKWKEERTNMDKNERKGEEYCKGEVRDERKRDKMQQCCKLNGKRLCEKEKQRDLNPQMEPSALIAPVFIAALACLEKTLQGFRGQRVALVYFQGLCHSRDIPKAFRGFPRYCLPQDFSGLIQELGGVRRKTETAQIRWNCWPRLLSKVLSIWMARQLAQRLQTLLPQTQGKRTPRATSSLKPTSDKTQNRLRYH